MSEFQVFNWTAIADRIRSKRVFLCWFTPLVFICVWVLTYSVPTYYNCTTSLSTEEMRIGNSNRGMTLNRPENFDLGLATMSYSIVADDYDELVASTDFICRVLRTPVMTADSSFAGSYYEYLATQHRYSWFKSLRRRMSGQTSAMRGEVLPPLDPFYPRDRAGEAIALAGKAISCDVDRQTKLTTISVTAQDPLVVALLAQAVADTLEQVTSAYYRDKTYRVYQDLQQQIAAVDEQRRSVRAEGDIAYADMLDQAYHSFIRQAIALRAQIRNYQIFTTLNNPSVPTRPAGPHHLSAALVVTFVIVLLALAVICRRELFGSC